MIRNDYEVENDIVIIKVYCKGNFYDCIVDKDVFENKIKGIDTTWTGDQQIKDKIYVKTLNKRKYYCLFSVDKARVPLHQYILDFPTENNDLEIDHINRNPLDNRKENLRIVTRKENNRNKRKIVDTKSGYTGVNWIKGKGKWVARISVNGDRKYIGIFNDKEEAIKARKEAENKYWGAI